MDSVNDKGDWLADIRRQIDALDNEILERCNRRARLALEVADAKRAAGETDYYRPDREATLLRRLCRQTRTPLEARHVLRIQREIISVCRSLETALQVAYCESAAGAERAAVEHFGHSVQTLALDGAAAVVEQVQSGDADFGVLTDAELIDVALADSRHSWSLPICAEVAANRLDQSSRILVIGKLVVPPTGEDKTSIILASPDPARDLALLEPWLIDSQDTGRAAQKKFLLYIELDRHLQDEGLKGAFEELSARGTETTVLGSYPRAVV